MYISAAEFLLSIVHFLMMWYISIPFISFTNNLFARCVFVNFEYVCERNHDMVLDLNIIKELEINIQSEQINVL